MNRFEALHTLDLDDSANDSDVRIAYHGIIKAAEELQPIDDEQISNRVSRFLEQAEQARDFLLANGTKARRTGGLVNKVMNAGKVQEKLKVSTADDAWARLSGFKQIRSLLLSYRDNAMTWRRDSIIMLVLCVVVGFVAIRYLRAAPRVVASIVMGVLAIAGSSILTTSQLKCRRSRAVLLDIDERIHKLSVSLGIEEEPEESSQAPEESPQEPGGLAGQPMHDDAEDGEIETEKEIEETEHE